MSAESTVFIVDDDEAVRESLQALVETEGYAVQAFDSARGFLDGFASPDIGCLVVDVRMPDMGGLELQAELVARGNGLPVIVVTGHGDVPLAVQAMKAGAVDFIEKPYNDQQLLDTIARALDMARNRQSQSSFAQEARERVASLTPREAQVLEHLVAGRANKVIAYELGISPRTIEIHRAHVMEKMQARSLSDLVRMALEAGVRTPE
ncbi:two-component system response regulator FixJ [Parvibaculum indicum]|uniref:response regulator FixJ n=1 Tax=Parvibaculum indicum TaxID=562969 RepID=UPI0014231A77|nr:response regulator FixJ [Parvibaculum indicum]NIJ41498.1 two-component system response regulator FixJ [Parvibaculum indicum]